jgi:KaiC/GvpD/RAD55 family RecA-like ATPase
MKVYKTYVEGLDGQMEGGIPKGHIVLISGPPGTMKSSVAYSILYNNARFDGVKGLFVCLEQTRKSLKFHMSKLGMTDEEIEKSIHLLDLSKIRKAVREEEQKPWLDILKKLLTDMQKEKPFEILAIDSLPVLEIMSNLKRKRTNLFHFFEWLRDQDYTTLLISEAATESPELLDEDFLADGIINLMMEKVGKIDVYRRMRCVKMRGVNHQTGYFTLEFKNGRFHATQVI